MLNYVLQYGFCLYSSRTRCAVSLRKHYPVTHLTHTPSPVCGLDTVHTALCGFALELVYDSWTSFVRFQFMLGDEVVNSALLESSSRWHLSSHPKYLSFPFAGIQCFASSNIRFIHQTKNFLLPSKLSLPSSREMPFALQPSTFRKVMHTSE